MAYFAIIVNGRVESVAVAGEPLASNWISLAGVNPRPAIGWLYANGVFEAPPPEVEPARVYQRIAVEAFWDRFTNAERLSYDVAMQHDPAATNNAKRDAARLRVFAADVAATGYLQLNKPKVRNFVAALVPAVLVDQARVDAILDTPISAEESY